MDLYSCVARAGDVIQKIFTSPSSQACVLHAREMLYKKSPLRRLQWYLYHDYLRLKPQRENDLHSRAHTRTQSTKTAENPDYRPLPGAAWKSPAATLARLLALAGLRLAGGRQGLAFRHPADFFSALCHRPVDPAAYRGRLDASAVALAADASASADDAEENVLVVAGVVDDIGSAAVSSLAGGAILAGIMTEFKPPPNAPPAGMGGAS